MELTRDRHVREEARVLPLDTAHRLVDLCLRGSHSGWVPLHGVQNRGEFVRLGAGRTPVTSLQERKMAAVGVRLTCGFQGKYDLRGKRRGDTIAEF